MVLWVDYETKLQEAITNGELENKPIKCGPGEVHTKILQTHFKPSKIHINANIQEGSISISCILCTGGTHFVGRIRGQDCFNCTLPLPSTCFRSLPTEAGPSGYRGQLKFELSTMSNIYSFWFDHDQIFPGHHSSEGHQVSSKTWLQLQDLIQKSRKIPYVDNVMHPEKLKTSDFIGFA